VSGAITYEEYDIFLFRLLAMIIPKTDKALAQRVLIRISKRGATLPNYLWKYFSQLFIMILLMTVLTDEARRKMQNSVPLNHL
jgi:ABC-type amino acid transport system permease subunit